MLKEQQKTLSRESKKLQQLRKTLEESLKEVRNKMNIIYVARDQAREHFAKIERENDLEIVYKYKGPGYHNPVRELAEEALKAGIIPEPLLNERKKFALIELQEKEEKAGMIWSEEKILENKISELIAKELQIESAIKNLRNQQRQKERELRGILISI